MFSITAHDIITFARTPSGDRFTNFVDALLRVSCFGHPIPDSAIHTNSRINKQDGGVDSRVDLEITDDKTGWMGVKTIWQYKAVESDSITDKKLREEINKWYSIECIKEGYAYRFCITDDIADYMKEDWKKILTQAARQINPQAPPAEVLTASDLKEWANRYPAFVLKNFHPQVSGQILHMTAWQRNVLDATPHYVPVPAWEGVSNEINRHFELNLPSADVILSVQAEAGVGKTRLVYETIAKIAGAEAVVLYAGEGEYALTVATQLANDETLTALLIADECSLRTREQLRNLLRGHRQRVRVVTIDNTGERPASAEPEYQLPRMTRDILDAILAQNFSGVPLERRQDYAQWSGCFVRLAVDMCRNDRDIVARGQIGAGFTAQSYYFTRLNEDQRSVIEALSLVQRVGYSEDIRGELDALCSWLNLDRAKFQRVANQIHDVPGFIARSGRYYYVTPEIIAQVAFRAAWKRFADGDETEFLTNIPEQFLEGFHRRVAHCDDEGVKTRVGDFFRRGADEFGPEDLANNHKVDRLIALIEIDPDLYLGALRFAVEQASHEQLLARDRSGQGRWESRRHIVWLVERLVAFPQYFCDAEYILRKLALAESEPHISNNATGVWKHLFVIQHSGTATPFAARLELLTHSIYSQDADESNLALTAFDKIFDANWSYAIRSNMVGSKTPPDGWEPKYVADYSQCVEAAFNVLNELSKNNAVRLSQAAYEIALKNLSFLLNWIPVASLQSLFDEKNMIEATRIELAQKLKTCLYAHRNTKPTDANFPKYLDAVVQWAETLRPVNLHERLVDAVSRGQWDYIRTGDEAVWQREIKHLAELLHAKPETLRTELDWLASGEARSAYMLGQELGRLDSKGAFLEPIFTASAQSKITRLPQGYIRGLLDNFPDQSVRVNTLLDEIERTEPAFAYELFMQGGDLTRAYERVIRLIDDKRLPPAYLHGFSYENPSVTLDESKYASILQRLMFAYGDGDLEVFRIAVAFIFHRINGNEETKNFLLSSQRILPLIWQVVEAEPNPTIAAISDWNSMTVYDWAEILKNLIKIDTARTAKIAANALVGGTGYLREQAMEVLLMISASDPDSVIKQIERTMFDDERAIYFFVSDFKSLFAALPQENLMQWLRATGVETARKMARHLPAPYVDAEGKPQVPPLTAFVLTEYANDDKVYREFSAGRHNLQLYFGDIAAEHEKEANIARQFLHHPIPRIREWAKLEIDSAQHNARWERLREAEESLAF